jgi:putative integral membrane protein (TIGR02587 family)
MGSSSHDTPRSVAQSLQIYGRGAAGGLLFSLPLLYTMEVWWTGFIAHPWRLVAYCFSIFILLMAYNLHCGLRRNETAIEVVIDSFDALGIGLLLAFLILWLTEVISFDLPVGEVVGKIVVEALIIAIGVSIGEAQLGGQDDKRDKPGAAAGQSKDSAAQKRGARLSHETPLARQLSFSFCGAVVFASSVAATDEIVIIAVSASSWKLLGLFVVSLLFSAVILSYGSGRSAQGFGIGLGFSGALSGCVITYMVALVASGLMLWFFGRFDGLAMITCVGETVVLGLVAAFGAAAGELLLQ